MPTPAERVIHNALVVSLCGSVIGYMTNYEQRCIYRVVKFVSETNRLPVSRDNVAGGVIGMVANSFFFNLSFLKGYSQPGYKHHHRILYYRCFTSISDS